MKKVLLTIISVCLIAASIFGLFAGVSSFSDIMNVKEYKEKDAKEGLESIDTLDAGLDQLQENEGTYLAGVDTYTAGLVSYSEGKSTLSAGYAAYYAGKKQLEEGKAAYAAGKKQIEDNTAAYNEGKATLAKIEPLMPRRPVREVPQRYDLQPRWFCDRAGMVCLRRASDRGQPGPEHSGQCHRPAGLRPADGRGRQGPAQAV